MALVRKILIYFQPTQLPMPMSLIWHGPIFTPAVRDYSNFFVLAIKKLSIDQESVDAIIIIFKLYSVPFSNRCNH